MKIVRFDAGQLGVLDGHRVIEISSLVPERWRGTPYAMTELIRAFDRLRPAVEALVANGPSVDLGDVRLLPPVPAPMHLLAAPLNYRSHVAEMDGSAHVGASFRASDARALGFFLKAPGSICGPQDEILLPPLEGRDFHHEVELGVILGRDVAACPSGAGLDAVFGYTGMIDVTMRASATTSEERVQRKSFETFTPMGPVIVTKDEVPDPGELTLRLWVNDELRQDAPADAMIVGVAELIERASSVMTLRAGDVYATGTPDGVGPIRVGDAVRCEIDVVGAMTLPVARRPW